MRNLPIALLLCFICCAASACAKPAYWIPGLTLPAGSTVVNQAETSNFQGAMAGIPMIGSPDKVLTVSFNSSSDWAAVSAHIDGCMSKAGYTESMSALAGMAGMAGQNMPGGVNPLDMTRMYTKQGEKFTVMLMNYKDILAASGAQAGAAQSIPGLGDYQLSVVRMK